MILDQIIKDSRLELESRKQKLPLNRIQEMALEKPHPLDFASVLRGSHIKLIAEVKKASPSRGLIVKDFDPVKIAKTYSSHGAAAISVLTETKFFQGSLDYLSYIDSALGNVRPPLLRKDFIYDPYQVYETRAFGADALLLIVAILEPLELKSLLELSHQLHLKCLVEVHNEEEANIAVKTGAEIIGINNRDLKTFKVDMETTHRLRPLIPSGRIVVSESGIKTRQDVEMLKSWKIDAVLVGESLLASGDIITKMQELL